MHSFETTAKDKLNFSPSPTARTPLELLVHVGGAINAFTDALEGIPMEFNKLDEIDAALRAWEATVKTEAEAKKILDGSSQRYVAWLDSHTDSDLEKLVETPFFTMPAEKVCQMVSDHNFVHAGQINYIQTIYGDRNWHIND